MYREKKAKPENSRKTTALRVEIGDEFGYSKDTVKNMISIGRIPSSLIGELEQFSISALKSLLPLRIGNINSNTGEDNNDYTLTTDIADVLVAWRVLFFVLHFFGE